MTLGTTHYRGTGQGTVETTTLGSRHGIVAYHGAVENLGEIIDIAVENM